MPKVLFVATLVKNHLMEFHIPYLEMFHRMGWETSVAANNDYEDPQQCKIPFCDNYYDIPFERSPLKLNNFKAYKSLKEIIVNGNYDIIHCHTPVGAMLARIAARTTRKKGTKVIYTAHGFHFYKSAPIINWLLYFPVEYVLAYITDVLITINREDYEFAKRILHTPIIKYIPGVGVNSDKIFVDKASRIKIREKWSIPQDAILLLSVGDLNKNKNHKLVLKAMKKLDNPDIYYIVCGRGELMEQHKRMVQMYHLENHVFFTGYQDQMSEFYSAADVFVFPSWREGLSVSVMEAMSCGLPIICSNIRGNTDLVQENVNGYLFSPSSVQELVEKLEKILCEDTRKKMSENNIRDSIRYNIKAIMPQYKKVYFASKTKD